MISYDSNHRAGPLMVLGTIYISDVTVSLDDMSTIMLLTLRKVLLPLFCKGRPSHGAACAILGPVHRAMHASIRPFGVFRSKGTRQHLTMIQDSLHRSHGLCRCHDGTHCHPSGS